RRIHEQKIDFVSVGIRSLCKEEADFISEHELKVCFAKDIHNNRVWMPKAVSVLKDKIYITLDIDVFDPSIITNTGTPEPGGLTWYTLIELFKTITQLKKRVVGFDVVEFSPQQQHNAESFTCAKLIYKMIGYFFT
ncbi:agmatinase, partial [candidate division KSB1 bacterium]|nr:agmatinase [candidate division KSB1 bacterium]